MNGMSSYDSTKDFLSGLLPDIKKGKIQLPEFQRDWVWDDNHVLSLLASVSLSYPIGAVMMLQMGDSAMKLKFRSVQGAETLQEHIPEWLILDGQQRLTALYQSLFSIEPVQTKDYRNQPIKRFYYIDIDKAILKNGDREEAIISVHEDKKIRNFRGEVTADYSSIDRECQAGVLPMNIILNFAALMDWQMRYFSIDSSQQAKRLEKWKILNEDAIKPIQQYQVPIIQLKKETPKIAVCQVFEKVNTGGVALTVFELLTATFAIDSFNLREDWQKRHNELKKYKAISNLQSEDFLQAISLISTKTLKDEALEQKQKNDQIPGISCKRKDILKLTSDEYLKWAGIAQQGFEKAKKFLFSQNIFTNKDLPYRTQLVPLAASLALLGSEAENEGIKAKIVRWYWCGIFGELYGSAVETRFAKDLPDILQWVKGGQEPTTINDANFSASRFFTLRSRNSAAYKGLFAILMKEGGLDFRTGDKIEMQSYFDERMDIHHIFPKSWCEKHDIPKRLYDSIVNKTALSASTNKRIGGRAPSQYLPTLERTADISSEKMNSILSSHLIDVDAIRSDDFLSFFKTRMSALIEKIEGAMGKPVLRDKIDFSAVPEIQIGEEEQEESEAENDFSSEAEA